jgi:hypothetical protein
MMVTRIKNLLYTLCKPGQQCDQNPRGSLNSFMDDENEAEDFVPVDKTSVGGRHDVGWQMGSDESFRITFRGSGPARPQMRGIQL